MFKTDLLARMIQRLQKAERLLDQLESAFKHKDTVANWSGLNAQFHTCLCQVTNCPPHSGGCSRFQY